MSERGKAYEESEIKTNALYTDLECIMKIHQYFSFMKMKMLKVLSVKSLENAIGVYCVNFHLRQVYDLQLYTR